MGIQAGQAVLGKAILQAGFQGFVQLGVLGAAGRDVLNMNYLVIIGRLRG
ncbi:MAG: hypothetical protein MUO99_07480 [Dehalococcoidales bacterium]|nr:hypothetical protein [Dehalococcoidales bacterium]